MRGGVSFVDVLVLVDVDVDVLELRGDVVVTESQRETERYVNHGASAGAPTTRTSTRLAPVDRRSLSSAASRTAFCQPG